MPEAICIVAGWLRRQLSPLMPGDGALLSIDMDDVLVRTMKAKKRNGATAEHLQLHYVRHSGNFLLKQSRQAEYDRLTALTLWIRTRENVRW
jgi:hypothetical protein